jgi:hypothetical protein
MSKQSTPKPTSDAPIEISQRGDTYVARWKGARSCVFGSTELQAEERLRLTPGFWAGSSWKPAQA